MCTSSDSAREGLDDLIRMKRAAGRPEDLLAVEELGALRDEIDGQARLDRRKLST